MWGWRGVRRRGGPETWYVAEKVSWVLIEIRNRWKGKGQFISSLLNPSCSCTVRFRGLTDKTHWLHVFWQMWHHLYLRCTGAPLQHKTCDLDFNFVFNFLLSKMTLCLKTNRLSYCNPLYRSSQATECVIHTKLDYEISSYTVSVRLW